MQDLTICCKLNSFDFFQSIFVNIDGNKANVKKIHLDEIPNHLNTYCKNFNTNKIHFFGDLEYINYILEKIDLNKYEIEVN